MLHKSIGVITMVFALAGLVFSIVLLAERVREAWYIVGGSLFAALVGVVIFRHGVKSAVRAVDDGIPSIFH